MRLHFEPDLDYQRQAIDAVCDLFRGQETCRTEFTVSRRFGAQESLEFAQSDLGIGNRLSLLDDELLANLREVQLRNALRPSESLASGDFTVEMETGTGKTYVYLRTIFELNRRYGFTKFVIVVPSIAIKEGVYKTLQITEEHFRALYGGVPFSKGNNYFLYDSSKLNQVRNFATSPQLQVMVVTVGAINKKEVNNLYKGSEKTDDEKPIDLIRATRPVVIVDEPQKVDSNLKGGGKEALSRMEPLCTLRYSATHPKSHLDAYHMVYRLDAVDAYEQKLVKQIEVAAATIENAHNKPYVKLLSVKSTKTAGVTASIEVHSASGDNVSAVTKTVQDKTNLDELTRREIYQGYRIGEIRAVKGDEFVELQFPGGEQFLRIGDVHGGVDENAVAREMIRRTIKEHLDKEKRLRPQGIKVLSLFFLGKVSDYRLYGDKEGKGPYALMFEEEYRRLARHPDYTDLFQGVDLAFDAGEVHDGYFAMDKQKRWVDNDEEGGNQADRDNAERAYSLIMSEKERLLSFGTPLKFIFSHSALREGWDNPNVFQICAFREMSQEGQRRQTIGRGLRLCVNQEGERVRGFDVNTLTVVATESYEQFAKNLQHDIEKDTGIRFGTIEQHDFASLSLVGEDGRPEPLGFDRSKALFSHLVDEGYLDRRGNVQDRLRTALKEGSVTVPDELKEQAEAIVAVLRKHTNGVEVKNADKGHSVKLKKGILLGEEFRLLWDRIKNRTTYRVRFDNEALIADCILKLAGMEPVSKTRLEWRRAGLSIGEAGVEANERPGADSVVLSETDIELPDVLTELQNRTGLTRRTLARILVESGRLDDFKRNPQRYIALTAEHIRRCKEYSMVPGIQYVPVEGGELYAQEIFASEIKGYLDNTLTAEHSIYEQVVYDSTPELNFAKQMESFGERVKLYAKLPRKFKVPTPLGDYNPDWAVVLNTSEGEKLYFVVETKSSLFTDDLRAKEEAKMHCGERHFEALATEDNPARYVRATKFHDVLERA